MAHETQIKSKNESDVWESFDQVLGRHIERLIGSRYGIGGLSLNSKTLSCLILGMERENEIQASSAPATKRYTRETLQHELNTLGFALNQDIDTLTRDMVEKGYFNRGDNGRLVPQKPARSMTQLLDRILPGMPGMNFVAYCIQTVDEVKTERKTLPDALSQLDQTLQLQGISIKGKPSPTKSKKASSPVPEQKKQMPKMVSSLQSKPRPSQLGALKPSNTLDSLKSKARPENSAFSPGRSKILSQNAYSSSAKIQEVHFGKPTLDKKGSEEFNAKADPEIEPQKSPLQAKKDQVQPSSETPLEEKVQPSSETPLEEIDEAIPSDPTPLESDVSAPDTPVSRQGPAIEKTDSAIDTTAANAASLAPEDETDIASPPENLDDRDDVIAKRIASFEEDLAMECPQCRHSKIRAHTTTSGKNYYKCSNETCGFITWGKPYHLQCPRCSNPFLIEASGKDGITILKCPRATCHHQQDPATPSRKPRKRLVRRKRVRRKK